MNQPARSGAWRALEDPSGPDAGADAEAGSPALPRGTGGARAGWVLGALAVATILAGAAVWMVVGAPHGTVLVEGAGLGSDQGGSPDVPALRGQGSARPDALVVDVQGAVVRPGIVRLPAGSRVADAIAAAGGYGPRVAAERLGQALNLAALVKDGEQVVVPSRDDPAGGPTGPAGGGGGPGATKGPVDLNRATAAELDALPGIGPVTAAKIVAAREEQAFASVDDLKTRKILGAATFDKIKALLVVR